MCQKVSPDLPTGKAGLLAPLKKYQDMLHNAAHTLQVRPRPQIPTLQQLQELSSTFGPASLIYVFKCLCYMLLQVSHLHLRP